MPASVWLVFRVTPTGERAGRLGRVIAVSYHQAMDAAEKLFAGDLMVMRKSEWEAEQRNSDDAA